MDPHHASRCEAVRVVAPVPAVAEDHRRGHACPFPCLHLHNNGAKYLSFRPVTDLFDRPGSAGAWKKHALSTGQVSQFAGIPTIETVYKSRNLKESRTCRKRN